MKTLKTDLPEIPHGHGLSFKKGVADGLLDRQDNVTNHHKTHSASYQRGVQTGAALRREINKNVKA